MRSLEAEKLLLCNDLFPQLAFTSLSKKFHETQYSSTLSSIKCKGIPSRLSVSRTILDACARCRSLLRKCSLSEDLGFQYQILQVIFGYVIKRATLFYVIGNIFRKRNKARIIHLYNKMLFVRINGRSLARARIRFQVERRILQREEIREKR